MIERKILVIDNQQMQYVILRDLLQRKEEFMNYDTHEEKYLVYPAINEFEDILNCVRVFLGPYYAKTDRQDVAFDYLLNYIEFVKPELLVIDYMLSATYEGRTGIDLVKHVRLARSKKFAKIPVIFLSRTTKNDKAVKDSLPEDEITLWVEKGYAGLENLDNSYLLRHLKSKIPALIGKSELAKQFDHLEQLTRDYETMPIFRDQIKNFKQKYQDKRRFRPELTNLIDEIYKLGSNASNTDIQKLINQLNCD